MPHNRFVLVIELSITHTTRQGADTDNQRLLDQEHQEARDKEAGETAFRVERLKEEPMEKAMKPRAALLIQARLSTNL